MRRTLVWFRNDLRLHDHRPLLDALAEADEVVPLVVLDEAVLTPNPRRGRLPIGPHRARFWWESIAALREALRGAGGELWLRVGRPETVVPLVAAELAVDGVRFHREVTTDERRQEAAIEKVLRADGRFFHGAHGATLLHPDDLPFSLADLPDVFTAFRKAVERDWKVRAPAAAPATVRTPSGDPGTLPTLADLGVEDVEPDPRRILAFVGGEAAGLQRLADYAFGADALRHYKETRNGLLEPNESSKLSPWLALGCLSPRWVHAEVRRYEAERVANDSTYWLVFELLWRDYWKFLALRDGVRLFQRSGVAHRELPWKTDRVAFDRWARGETGFPFVDAFMKELTSTGFMSNRGRQNVASFLAKSLGVDWRLGADFFEAHLLDYDPASNWGNWQYAAGVGTDPRDRVFNVIKQGKDYDPDGAYVRRWLPHLADVPDASVHEPWRAGGPEPMLDPHEAFRRPPPKKKRRGRRAR